ncbi:serine/threonine protein kinase, putative [Plasmodium chabaudi chabaudi]|uniref:non-specific serine/threonine protein kinase n=1 Tax=Plasmodium chabaudi chabaudi TaxID=31271 RepID=A0A4V0K2S0_PLACU|nr:serine/threonine protein kinase, putative [Plasmodium chabaudi chabaudi]VTZ67146.1 serine/threonine protein kinase, putative [Plasmodium chabaudi chabaudi]|eukprot:XP_016653254.1 serine/threonine protein kinase, putative [Plasmodium chabaudi chabaudi]
MSYSDSMSASNNSSNQDATSGKLQYTESDDEGSDEYCPGGYHPVEINEIYNDRYRIEGKLGWGHFSTVWIATDLKSKPLKFVAIKIQKGSETYTESAKCEINYLKTVKINSFDSSWVEFKEQQRERLFHYNMTKGVVSFIDSFEHKGPNGTHVCMVFEFMGPNLLSLIKHYDYKGIPINLVRKIATHVLIGLQYLHDVCKIIHSDIKPENVVVSSLSNIPKPRDYTKSKLVNNNDDKDIKNATESHYNSSSHPEQENNADNEKDIDKVNPQADETEQDETEQDDTESNVTEVKEQNEFDNVDWNKLTKNEKKKLKRKKKKMLKKERLKMNEDNNTEQNKQTNNETNNNNLNHPEDNSHFKKEDNEAFRNIDCIKANDISLEPIQISTKIPSNNSLNANLKVNTNKDNNAISGECNNQNLNENSDIKLCKDENKKDSKQILSNTIKKDLSCANANMDNFAENENKSSDLPKEGTKEPIIEDNEKNKINDNNDKVNVKKKKKKINEPPYVKHRLKPTNSDPSLLTTYYNIHAIQETLTRKPYHYNNYFLNNPEKYGYDKSPQLLRRLPIDYLRNDSSMDGSNNSCNDNNENTNDTYSEKSEIYVDKDANKFPIYCGMFNHLIHPEAMKLHESNKKKNIYSEVPNENPSLGNNKNPKVVYIKTEEGDYCIRPYDPTVYYHEKSCYKICDLGNSLWIDESRYAEIQTRQYRAPEVILKSGFNETADIWSFACMVFELVTGDFLFNPQKSDIYDKNEEHLSFIIEVLGNIPKSMIDSGYNSHKYFNKNTYKLKNIKNIKRYGLYKILKYKYGLPEKEINPLCSFLLPMLSIDPQTRPSAYTMLQHPWLNMVDLEDDEQTNTNNRSYSVNTVNFKNQTHYDIYQDKINNNDNNNTKYLSQNHDKYSNFDNVHANTLIQNFDEASEDSYENHHEMRHPYQNYHPHNNHLEEYIDDMGMQDEEYQRQYEYHNKYNNRDYNNPSNVYSGNFNKQIAKEHNIHNSPPDTRDYMYYSKNVPPTMPMNHQYNFINNLNNYENNNGPNNHFFKSNPKYDMTMPRNYNKKSSVVYSEIPHKRYVDDTNYYDNNPGYKYMQNYERRNDFKHEHGSDMDDEDEEDDEEEIEEEEDDEEEDEEEDEDDEYERSQYTNENDDSIPFHNKINFNEYSNKNNNIYENKDNIESYFNKLKNHNKNNLVNVMQNNELNKLKNYEAIKNREKTNAQLKEQTPFKFNEKNIDNTKNKLFELEQNYNPQNMGGFINMNSNKKFDKFENIEKSHIETKNTQGHLSAHKKYIHEKYEDDKENQINCKVVNKKNSYAFT